MKKILALLTWMLCTVSACLPGSYPSHIEVLPTLNGVPQTPFIPTPTPDSGFTPEPNGPLFYAAYATLDPEAQSGERIFAPRTKQIYVKWFFQNMAEGMIVKRVWYLDGKLWLTKEEAWDSTKNGAFGLLPGVSIYDFDNGLPSGKYQLEIYIDNVLQPIGLLTGSNTADAYLQFEILPVGSSAPNGQWKVESTGTKLILTDGAGKQSDLYTGREILSTTWVDNQHILFIDRDRLHQLQGSQFLGIKDELYIADVQSREIHLLYQSGTLLGYGGLFISQDGIHVATIEGSGYGDACFMDSKPVFIELSGDYKSANIIHQEQFAGFPQVTDQTIYATTIGSWTSRSQFTILMTKSCSTEKMDGSYVFDLSNRTVTIDLFDDEPPSVGDLGWGQVHGLVTDAITDLPIQQALVVCEHSSYVSEIPQRCTGGIETLADGSYVFDRIFFHDTDKIKLTITAEGYLPQEFTQNGFSINDLTVNFLLMPAQ